MFNLTYPMKTDAKAINAAVEALTQRGLETMKAIGEGRTSYFDEGIVEYSGIWGSCLTQELGHKSSGVINRLRDLGLFQTSPAGEDDDSDWWALTALGADVANFLAGNLKQDEEYVVAPVEVNAETGIAAPVRQATVKVGRKWTTIHAADGSLIAEVRNDQYDLVRNLLLHQSI